MINIKDTFFLCKKLCYNIACLLRELEGSSGTLVNLATEYGLVCPFGGLFQF